MTRSWFRTRTIPMHQHIPVCLSLLGFACLLLAGLTGCDEGPTGGGGGQGGGLTILASSVHDGDNDVSLYPTLEWVVPEELSLAYSDAMVFDVYFGRDHNPRLVAQGISEMHYHAGPLEYGEEFHWRVVARSDGGGTSSSPVWSFSTVDEFCFPLAEGNLWRYEVATSFGGEPDLMEYIITAQNAVDCPDSCNIWELILSQGGPVPEPPYSKYLQNESGLYVVHSKIGGSTILPKAVPTSGIVKWRGHDFASVRELAALFGEAPPREFGSAATVEGDWMTVLEYPLEEGSIWVFNSLEQGGAFTIVKEVTAVGVDITTDAGLFPCHEIRWWYDLDNDGQSEPDISVLDYVGPVGLVRREVRIEGVYRYDYEGNIICRCTFESIQKLTDFTLH